MTHRERVLAALSHEQPDRCPCDYSATPEISAALGQHFGEGVGILAALDTDTRKIGPRYVGPELKVLPDGSKEDVWGVIRSPMSNEYGQYMEPSYLPWQDMTTLDDVAAYRWPRVEWYDFSHFPEQCLDLDEYAIGVGGAGYPDMINGTAFGRGVERVIMGIATEDPVTLAIMNRRVDFQLAMCERMLDAGGGRIDLLFTGDDYGTQNGLLMHPGKWRKIFKPALQKFLDLAHSHGARMVHHCCGSSREIMEDYIEIGLDCLQTIQPRAQGMDPGELKRLFGDRLSFHGAIDAQGGLQNWTPEETREVVLHTIRVVGRSGGYVCAPSHNIQPDTPVENVLAMYRAIHESAGLG